MSHSEALELTEQAAKILREIRDSALGGQAVRDGVQLVRIALAEANRALDSIEEAARGQLRGG